MAQSCDALGFYIPAECSPEQVKYLKCQVSDPNEFVRAKNAESMWMKLSSAFNQGKCTIDQLYAEIHQMRHSVIVHGIPLAARARAYLLLAGLTDAQVAAQQDTYESLVSTYFDLPETSALRRDIKQDLERTFPDHSWFVSDSNATKSLHRLLGAFAIAQPSIGYCQSLNFLAGFLLIIFEHKEIPAFAVLEFLVENILQGYHSRSLCRIMADMNVLDALIEQRSPAVHEHFKKYNVSISLFAPNWFMSGFLNNLPGRIVAHLWDWMLLDKDLSVLFRMALGLISLKEESIVNSKGTNELVAAVTVTTLDELTSQVKLPALISYVHQTIKRVPLASLQELREEAYNQQITEFREYQTKKDMVFLSRTTQFDENQIIKLREKFMKAANEDGLITVEQLEHLLQRLPITKNSPELIQLYLRIFDKKRNRMVEFTDIAAGLSVMFAGSSQERLKLLFQAYDEDDSGMIGRNQVVQLINTIYAFYYDPNDIPPDTEKFVGILFDNLDTRGLGKLTFEDFQKALLLQPKLARCFVPQSNEAQSKVEGGNMFGLIPLLASGKYDEKMGQKPTEEPTNSLTVEPLSDDAKVAVRSKFNSRNELLDELEGKPPSKSSKGGGAPDESCCSIC